jgi:hypothetical protein
VNGWSLESDLVRLEVGTEGGFLEPHFKTSAGMVLPLHVAPWRNEILSVDTPPMLRGLRGDFFCAPFGSSDLIPEETRPHGTTANGIWRLVSQQHLGDDQTLELELEHSVMGARVRKRISLKTGHPVVYQEHIFHGGSGAIPLGHHAMLRTSEPLLLGFSDSIWAGTPPEAPEPDLALGRSSLKYPQVISSLGYVQLEQGGTVDLRQYPTLERSEDLLMLVANPNMAFAWSAATNQQAGWVWFALKNPRVLHSTVLWLSNGGRNYAPFSGRHTGVIGIEEVTAYFHLGHHASVEPNPLSDRGIVTSLELQPDRDLSVRYVFGLAEIPRDFEHVIDIRATSDGIVLEDAEGRTAHAVVNLDFIRKSLEIT